MTALEVIATALGMARSGLGSLVVLTGPLGCGRSTALRDARRLAESLDVRVLRATGARQERGFPFGVVHQLTGGEFSGPTWPGGLHEVLVAAGPALVTVDDLQWADERSLRALADSADQLDRLPVVLAVGVRDGDVGSGSPLVEQIIRRAAHVVALQRPLLAASSKPKLVTCLRAQPPRTRRVLDAMAVLGDDADLELIMSLAEADEIGGTTELRAMDRLGLVDQAVPRFAHDVVREAVEATMAPADRVRLQAKAVRLLYDAGRPAEVVAGRLLAITSVQGLWAVEVLRTAAAEALERGAPLPAVACLRRALLEQSGAGRLRATLLVELAAAERGIDRVAATHHLSAAARIVTSTQERAAIAARFVPAALVETPPPEREVLQRIEDELRVVRPHDDVLGELALRIEARSHHVECMASGRSVRCVERLGEFPDETLSATSAGRELLSVRLHCATTASVWRAGDVAAVAQRLLAHEPPEPGHVHTPIATLVTTLCAADSVDAVSVWLHSAMERSIAANAIAEQVFIEAEQALVLLRCGRMAAARSIAEKILATTETPAVASEVLVTLASIALETQDDHLVSRLVGLIKEKPHTPALSVADRLLRGAARVAAGDLQAGLACVMDAGGQLTELGWRNPVLYPWRSEATRILCRLDDVSAARELAVEQHELAVEWGSAAGIGRALCDLGSMTKGEAGAAMLRQAVSVLEGSANRLELARALWQAGTRTDDRDYVEQSWAVAAECGAGTPVAGQEACGSTLTDAQRRVAGLAAAGHSNHEIADLMQVGVRVVEKHLTNAYRKLGVQGRNGLPAVLHAAGLGRLMEPGATDPRDA